MSELLPFVLFGVAFAVLVAVVLRKGRASKEARRVKLASLGFEPCDSETDTLTERIRELENNRAYRCSIEAPLRATLGGKPVYHYTKSRHRQGWSAAAEEILLPLERPSSQGLVLFIKPTPLQAGTATHLIGAIATGGWDSQPDDLKALDIPPDLKGTNLIGALGPQAASFYDLIDGQTMTLMQHLGDAGVMIVNCRDAWCSLSAPSLRMPFDLDQLWPLLDRLAAA